MHYNIVETAKNILLVEDNPGDVELTLEALKEGVGSHQVHIAEDGEEAIDFLRKKGKFERSPTPDLILLDLNLPKKDGHEVLEIIKQDNRLKSIPVIILTSSASNHDVATSYSLNANAYVIKPSDLNSFFIAVKAIKDFWTQIVKLQKVER